MLAGPNISVFVTSVIFTALSFVLVGLRLYTRIVVVQNVGVDDYLMPAALVSVTTSFNLGNIVPETKRLRRRLP